MRGSIFFTSTGNERHIMLGSILGPLTVGHPPKSYPHLSRKLSSPRMVSTGAQEPRSPRDSVVLCKSLGRGNNCIV